jgi:predicted acyltransferase
MASDPAASPSSRIVSMDQFRGYTVAGMIFVNFIDRFAVSHPVFSHHNTYFSYADTIMPAFHFAVGFAFRLTLLRRLAKGAPRQVYWHFLRRNLGLILLSIVLAGLGDPYHHWNELKTTGLWGALAAPLKCYFWETLAIIGVTSIWVMPVMATSVRVRLMFLAFCAATHVVISHFFYFHFLWARPNALDSWWGATDTRGLDGGPFGFLAWAIPQLVGSLAYDLVADRRWWRAFVRVAALATLLMLLGYGLSCLTVLYSFPQSGNQDAREAAGAPIASSPVLPPGGAAGKEWRELLAEPPFVPPPDDRPLNYWMMCKRAGSLSFMLFSSGFSAAMFGVFILLSEIGSLRIGVFRTFGQNPLAAYIIHGLVNRAVSTFAPDDSPLWWVVLAFGVYAGVTYLFVRHLEKNGIYLRM